MPGQPAVAQGHRHEQHLVTQTPAGCFVAQNLKCELDSYAQCRMMTQEMLKGMDADGRAKMEELLKNVRTKGPAGSGGLFGALPVHGPSPSIWSSTLPILCAPAICRWGRPCAEEVEQHCWQVARAAARSLSTSRTC